MTDETQIPQLDRVAAVLDGLSDATLLELYRTLLPFDNDMIAAAVARRALDGGSGSQPFKPSAGDDVVIAEYSDGSPMLAGGDDSAGLSVTGQVVIGGYLNVRVDESDEEPAYLGLAGAAAPAVFQVDAGSGAPASLDCADLPIINLPTSDPGIAGALWNNSGIPAISMG